MKSQHPRASRQHFGALLLGYHDARGKLRYAGSVGTGFSDNALASLARQLKKLERDTPPFVGFPESLLATAHFVSPKYVAQVRFNEWTSTGMLRHPAFLGMRDDKNAADVVRERNTRPSAASKRAPLDDAPVEASSPGSHVEFTNLNKVFFPVPRITKGRLLQYYADIAPYLLPALRDRPMVLKRFPNGITQEAFYQQKHPGKVPNGVRVEAVADDGPAERRLIGGDIATLLYMIQLGAISTDPWHSRVATVAEADYSIVDLDPGPDAKFKRVVQVARWVKDELDERDVRGVHRLQGDARGCAFELRIGDELFDGLDDLLQRGGLFDLRLKHGSKLFL